LQNTAASPEPEVNVFAAGLLTRRVRWGLSAKGWFVLCAFVAVGIYLVFANIYPFLAVTQRVSSDTLVVEGWIHHNGIKAAVAEYTRGGYHRVFTTGGPVVGKGGYINDYNTSASVGADELKRAGIPASQLESVPSRVMGSERTYSAAVALKQKLMRDDPHISSINIVTEGTHARRTRLLFQEALGPGIEVGIISVPDGDYDVTHWWRYSDGVRGVIGEGIAWVYARCFFHPSFQEASQK
jgi:uncharacterized SAM-binding protein YcdF (DUF218 family)